MYGSIEHPSHVKKLEEELGVVLLNRHNPVTLTNAGQQLHSYAVQMIALHNKAKKIFKKVILTRMKPFVWAVWKRQQQ